jgi:hypothetical protein
VSARNRPPKLESHAGESRPAPPPTVEELIERAKVAGAGSGPGPTELRRTVERMTAGDRGALGELAPMTPLSPADAWSAVTEVFGATRGNAAIDPARTIAATRRAAARVAEVAAGGARVAVATAHPASLMMLHLAFARLAPRHGGTVVELPDVGPMRADGRTPRWLRWIGGVAVVSDADSVYATRDGEAAREWVFAIPRPALVIADGPFAEVAWEAGIEVVALAGLDRPGLAVASAHGNRCTLVPMRTDRPPRAYVALEELVGCTGAGPLPAIEPAEAPPEPGV